LICAGARAFPRVSQKATIFARDMDMTINNPCWKTLRAPWLLADEADAVADEAIAANP